MDHMLICDHISDTTKFFRFLFEFKRLILAGGGKKQVDL